MISAAVPTAQNILLHATRYRVGEDLSPQTILVTTLPLALTDRRRVQLTLRSLRSGAANRSTKPPALLTPSHVTRNIARANGRTTVPGNGTLGQTGCGYTPAMKGSRWVQDS